MQIDLQPNKKIYFASDFHLGAPNHADSLVRERKVVAWLDSIKADAQVVCLVGDIFDFWFEHKLVAPKGFVRLLGKLAELTDAGIQVLAFPGNHDMWVRGYFEQELGIKTFRKPVVLDVRCWMLDVGKKTNIEHQTSNIKHQFYITHGDGLGPGDYKYKVLKVVFESKLARWLFGNLLPADFALWLGQSWAKYSWQKHEKEGQPTYLGEDKEWLVQYAKSIENQTHNDFYIFGHRHILLDLPIATNARIVILGDWINYFSYGVFDGVNFELKQI